ncbi:perilipin-3-like [Mauremys reevesii]|uniref:perilipin-3-like n=1 Tax=Mauremys reevesii TaxID=260615 RepID=UPI00193F5C26|nr:perilipin-3-like [Mauremys reevesii]
MTQLAEKGASSPTLVASDNKELVSCMQATVCSAISAAKHSVDMAKEVVHNSIETATAVAGSNVNKLMGSSIGQILMSGIDAVLKKPEELIVHRPPMTDESLAKLETSLEGSEMGSVEQQNQLSSSTKLTSIPWPRWIMVSKWLSRLFPSFNKQLPW